MADAQDRKIVKDAENALDVLFEKYEEAEPADKWLLKPAIKKASEELLYARLALFKEGQLSNQQDVVDLAAIEKDIVNAANAQSLIMSALKLAAFLAVFA